MLYKYICKQAWKLIRFVFIAVYIISQQILLFGAQIVPSFENTNQGFYTENFPKIIFLWILKIINRQNGGIDGKKRFLEKLMFFISKNDHYEF